MTDFWFLPQKSCLKETKQVTVHHTLEEQWRVQTLARKQAGQKQTNLSLQEHQTNFAIVTKQEDGDIWRKATMKITKGPVRALQNNCTINTKKLKYADNICTNSWQGSKNRRLDGRGKEPTRKAVENCTTTISVMMTMWHPPITYVTSFKINTNIVWRWFMPINYTWCHKVFIQKTKTPKLIR